MRTLQATRDVALALAGLAVVSGVMFYMVTRPTQVIPVYGEDLYLRYCASCHGISGKGDGAAAWKC